MELSEIIVLLGITAIFIVGFIGLIIPIIPSLPIVWGGIVLYGAIYGFTPEFNHVILWTGIIALIGTVLDTLMSVVGARIYGASTLGMIGAFVGGIIGFLILSLPGLILGSFLGTFLCEYLTNTDQRKSLRAAWGTMIGFVGGVLLKLVLCSAMVVMFFQYVL